jgi:dihydroorotase
MPNNPVPTTTRAALETKKQLSNDKALVDVNFYGGVRSENLDALSEIAAGVVGYKVYLAGTTGAAPFPESELGHMFREILRLNKPVSLHCENQAVIDSKRGELKGVSRPDVHCDIRPPEAEVASVRQVVAALAGPRTLRANVCHASTGETLSLVKGAKADGLNLSCEATLHHLYFNRRAMLANRMLKTNPPLRSEEDRQAMVTGISNGSVAFLVTDHAPHTEEEKRSGLSGVPGLDDYGHVVSWLIAKEQVDPVIISKTASSNPAMFSKMDDRGEISVGKRADFTVLDIRSPEKVNSDRIQSKCGWTPYEGIEFPGKVRWTIRAGEALLDDYELAA